MRTRLPAILMTAPAGAVVSHQTAAALWRVEIPLQRTNEPAHLTVPAASKARNRRDRRLHRASLRPDEVDRWWGLPVTTPARTWRDLASVLQPAALLAVTDQLLDVLCRPADLERALGRAPAGRGAARCRRVLAVADPEVDSPMESVVRWLLYEAGLPRPTLQYQAFDVGPSAGARAEPARRGGQAGPSWRRPSGAPGLRRRSTPSEPAGARGLDRPAVQLRRRPGPTGGGRGRRPAGSGAVSSALSWAPSG